MMSVDEALEYFAPFRSIAHPLQLLQDVGLGYLTLGPAEPDAVGRRGAADQAGDRAGQGSRTHRAGRPDPAGQGRGLRARGAPADGGAAPAPGGTLYVLDEPTVGLHMADVEKLIQVMHRLVDAGNTLVVIEHNLDIWAEADWIIDLGPEGGVNGGRVVAEGRAGGAGEARRTHTEAVLAEFLERQLDAQGRVVMNGNTEATGTFDGTGKDSSSPAGAVLALLAVAAGAFAAHGLKARLGARDAGDLRARRALPDVPRHRARRCARSRGRAGPGLRSALAAALFFVGIVLFCGSLYVLSLTGVKWLGAVTPFGGTAWLIGWGALAWASIKY